MMKTLAITLVGYLMIGVVYGLVKVVREVVKRVRLLGYEDYYEWLEGMNHLDEFDISKIDNDNEWSEYVWYFRIIGKLNDANVNKVLRDVVYVLTWPVAVPLFIEVVSMALDIIYKSRFGEEG